MKILSILSILCIMGCSTLEPAPGIYTNELSIQPHIVEYLAEKNRYLYTSSAYYAINVELSDLSQYELGQCEKITESVFGNKMHTRTIRLDRTYWFRSSDSLREQLLFHELGHCDLDRGHVLNGEIMNPRAMNDGYYVTNRDDLIRYLFTGF